MMLPMFISLSHFCDKHGPRVLLVTQFNCDSKNPDSLLLPDYPLDSYCDSCILKFPPVENTSSNDDENIRSMRTVVNGISFVSTQYSSVRYQLLYSIIRKAFSSETMVYDMSPVILQDDINMLNLVMGFKLYDEHARGNERRYMISLTVDSKEHVESMNVISKNFNFITNCFNKIVQYIKNLRETQIKKLLQEKDSNHKNVDDLTPIFGSFLRPNKDKISINLTQLTNDEKLFLKLHKWNTFMLNSLCQKRL